MTTAPAEVRTLALGLALGGGHDPASWQTRLRLVDLAEDLGLPFFPSRFVTLRINGSDAGLYLENEHPTREYLWRTGLPLSSIFTFSAWWTVYYAEETYHARIDGELTCDDKVITVEGVFRQ